MVPERPSYLPPITVRRDRTNTERDADPSHIPLPLSANSLSSTHEDSRRIRSGSAASRAGRAGLGTSSRSPPYFATSFSLVNASTGQSQSLPTLPPLVMSTTHAGGILPSASFFHPSRPNYYPDANPSNTVNNSNPNSDTYPVIPMINIPRSTVLANSSDPRPESSGSDSFAQTSFTTEEFGMNGAGKGGLTSNVNTLTGSSTISRSFSTKVSREPLLPIGQKSKPKTHLRPSASVDTKTHRNPEASDHQRKRSEGNSSGGSGGSSNPSPGGRVRTSLEKFWRRTLSLDHHPADIAYGSKELSTLPVNVEDLEARGFDSIDPHIEFKANSGDMFNDNGIMDISIAKSDGTVNYSLVRRNGNSAHPMRFPDFDSVPPNIFPPASHTPMLTANGMRMRKYQLNTSNNAFFLRGHLLTGGDSAWPFVGSTIIALGMASTWLGTTAVWWWKHESPAVTIIGAYMCLLTIANMFATAFSDPGILPRNLDPDPPYPAIPSEDGTRIPLPRDLKIRLGVVRVKYCQTCRIYRPPRSSHCRMCDNCVDGCDHHCQWVNNCVGRRNYTSFIIFLSSATATLCLFICTSVLHLLIQAHEDNISAGASLRKGAGSAVVFAVSALMIWPVGSLLGYHMRLLLLNLTTIEQIRNSAHKSLVEGPAPPNPFALGSWRHNLAEMLCRPQGMSWKDSSAIATVDRREPNPGSEIKGT